MRSIIACCLLSISLVMARPEGGHHKSVLHHPGQHHDLLHHVPPGHHDIGHHDIGHHDIGHHGIEQKSFGGHHEIGHKSLGGHHDIGHHDIGHNSISHHGGGGYNDHSDHHGSGQYGFEYAVKDPHYGGNFGHVEHRDGYVTKGSYFVDLPDGRRQTVTYTADEYGYHPVITYDGEAHYDDAHHGGGGYGGPSHGAHHGPSHGAHHGPSHGAHHGDGGYGNSHGAHHGIGPIHH